MSQINEITRFLRRSWACNCLRFSTVDVQIAICCTTHGSPSVSVDSAPQFMIKWKLPSYVMAICQPGLCVFLCFWHHHHALFARGESDLQSVSLSNLKVCIVTNKAIRGGDCLFCNWREITPVVSQSNMQGNNLSFSSIMIKINKAPPRWFLRFYLFDHIFIMTSYPLFSPYNKPIYWKTTWSIGSPQTKCDLFWFSTRCKYHANT